MNRERVYENGVLDAFGYVLGEIGKLGDTPELEILEKTIQNAAWKLTQKQIFEFELYLENHTHSLD